MSVRIEMPLTWLQLKKRFQEDPEFEKVYKERKKYLQQIRFNNPVVREKHRIACQKSKDKKCHPNLQIVLQPTDLYQVDFS